MLIKKVSLLHPIRLFHTTKILYKCGKDMADKCDLHHWDNSFIKTLAIVVLGISGGGTTYLVYKDIPVGTFKVKKISDDLHFGKLATLPECSGKGIGSWCMNYIEQIAKETKCSSVCMEVYDKSTHAQEFYLHRGYAICGEIKTLKYSEYKMRKEMID